MTRQMMLFWFSLLLQPVLIPIGMLGPTLLGLSVNASVILTVFATLIGTTIPAFAATLCPQTGLRQIAVSRFAFGIEGAKLIGLLNIVVNAGYGVVSAVVGGELIAAVSEETVPLALGIVIIVLLGFVVSFLGYAVIHLYERYAWFVAFILFCVTYGQSAKFFSPSPGLSTTSGIDYTGGCLSYFAIVFGVCASWSSIAGDYVVHYHADTSKWLIFGLTYFGQVLPTIFVGVLGNLFGGIVTSHEDLAAAYGEGGTGELLLEVLTPIGWAKTASVLFFLSFRKWRPAQSLHRSSHPASVPMLQRSPQSRHSSHCPKTSLSIVSASCCSRSRHRYPRPSTPHITNPLPSWQHNSKHLLRRPLPPALGQALDRGAALALVPAALRHHPGPRPRRARPARGHPGEPAVAAGVLDARLRRHPVPRGPLVPPGGRPAGQGVRRERLAGSPARAVGRGGHGDAAHCHRGVVLGDESDLGGWSLSFFLASLRPLAPWTTPNLRRIRIRRPDVRFSLSP